MALQIPLTKGKVATIDEVDAHLSNYKWCLHDMGYAMKGFKYRENNVKKQGINFLHHSIMGRPLNGLVVDHIDGNKLNNTRGNLRIVTFRENTSNRRIHRGEKHKSCKCLGVHICKRNYGGKIHTYFRSIISINGKQKHLGYFKTEEEGAEAYQKALNNLEQEN